jgi:hypothetical protein
MAQLAKDISSNTALVAKIEKNLGKSVLGLLELPATAQEAKLISALGLKEGDIIASLDIGGIHDHTWSCSVSLPPDCAVDADG